MAISKKLLQKILTNIDAPSIDWVIHDHSNDGIDSYGTIETNGKVTVEENNNGFTIDNPNIINAFVGVDWEIDEDLGGEYGCLLKSLKLDLDDHDLACFLMIPFESEEDRDTLAAYM
jgi:hypothetical protein